MKKVGIKDFSSIKKLGNLNLSPSGKKATFTVTTPDVPGNRYRTEIWVYDETHSPALYRPMEQESARPGIFLDEDTLLIPGDFLKKHPSTPAVQYTPYHRLSLTTGKLEEAFVLPFSSTMLTPVSDSVYLTRGKRDLSLPDLDGMSESEKADALKEWEESKSYDTFDELPFWSDGMGIINKTRHGLYLIDTAAGTQKLISPHNMNVWAFQLNENRTKAVYWGADFTTVNMGCASAFIYDLTDGTQIEIPLGSDLLFGSAVFVGDDIIFTATTGENYSYFENKDFYLCKPDGTFSLLAPADISFGALGTDVTGGGSSVPSGDGFYFQHVEGYHGVYSRLTPDGSVKTLVGPEDITTVSAAAGREGLVFFIGAQTDRAQELYLKRNGKTEQLSSFNEEYFSTHATAHTEHFTFLDSDGVEIDGWILRPADFDESRSYPAILAVHGGPKSAYTEIFTHEWQYWAGRGYIIFYCNPRGSTGKGDAFADIYGEKYGVVDFNCLMDFTDEVLRRVPQIDPARVGMTGISYGGFMANWIIGHTDRFSAVVSQCSISNYFSKCLTTDIGYYWNLNALECDPWSSPEEMWAHSPLAYADKVKTPTLFIQADRDYRCWMDQPVQMLQALLLHGVPAKMCLFHGDSHVFHEIGQPRNRVNRLKEIIAWFDKYLSPRVENA